MRKADLIARHDSFKYDVEWYRDFLNRVTTAQKVLRTMEDKREVAEMIVLRLCAHWEYYIDEVLVSAINRDHSQLSAHFGVTIPPHPSIELCQALLFGDGYKDFPSFGSLKGFSKKILPKASNPFLPITPANWKRIDEVYAIRNYLSHYSAKARRTLFDMYKKNHEMSRFLEPGQFLLAYEAMRFHEYIDAFEGAADQMKTWTEEL